MIAKPDPQTVIDLTDTELSEPIVQSIIDDAALIAEKCISGYSEEKQKSVLKWLAAHLIASTDSGGMIASERLGDAQDQYVRASVGDGIKGTVYGQQAIALSPCLARIGRAAASIEVV